MPVSSTKAHCSELYNAARAMFTRRILQPGKQSHVVAAIAAMPTTPNNRTLSLTLGRNVNWSIAHVRTLERRVCFDQETAQNDRLSAWCNKVKLRLNINLPPVSHGYPI